jgi:hypothetical protein
MPDLLHLIIGGYLALTAAFLFTWVRIKGGHWR